MHDEPPFPQMLFGYRPEGIDHEVREGRVGKRASSVSCSTLISNVVGDHLWTGSC